MLMKLRIAFVYVADKLGAAPDERKSSPKPLRARSRRMAGGDERTRRKQTGG